MNDSESSPLHLFNYLIKFILIHLSKNLKQRVRFYVPVGPNAELFLLLARY